MSGSVRLAVWMRPVTHPRIRLSILPRTTYSLMRHAMADASKPEEENEQKFNPAHVFQKRNFCSVLVLATGFALMRGLYGLSSRLMKAALRIAFLYAILSGLYIIISDAMVLEVAKGDQNLLAQWQKLKGLSFVTMSALIIFFLVLHYVRGRDRAESRLRELRESFEKLFEGTPVPTYAFDSVTREFLAANEAAIKEYGYSREEFLGLTLDSIYPVEERERVLAHLARIAHYPHAGRWHHQRRDGTIFPVEIVAHSIVLGERTVRMVVAVNGSIRELTEQALAEAAMTRQDAEETRTKLLSTISHEMRTPLNAIMGGLDLIVHGEEADQRREYAGIAQDSARELLDLIQRFIDAAALRSSNLLRRVEVIELRPFFSRIVDGAIPLAETKGLKIDLQLDATVPGDAELDASRLGETVRILLGNAIKFSDQGTVTVSGCLRRVSGQDTLEVAVSDEGTGIPPEMHEQVFDSFFQGDQSLSRQYGGTGLGLFVARQMCDLAGATLSLSSEPGRGSTFTIKIVGSVDGERFVVWGG